MTYLPETSLVYVASPYIHPDPAVVEARFAAVEAFTAGLIRDGVIAYSPIVHSHEMAQRHELPGDFAYWRAHNERLLGASDRLFVLCLDGWRASVGVQAEIGFWRRLGRVPLWFRPDGTEDPALSLTPTMMEA